MKILVLAFLAGLGVNSFAQVNPVGKPIPKQKSENVELPIYSEGVDRELSMIEGRMITPEDVKKEEVVKVKYDVDEEGNVVNVKFNLFARKSCVEETERLLSMVKEYCPGRVDGEKAIFSYELEFVYQKPTEFPLAKSGMRLASN